MELVTVHITDRIRSAVAAFRNAGILESPSVPLGGGPGWWQMIDGAMNSEAGVRVGPMTAIESSIVMGCVKLLAGSVSQLPLRTYKISPDSPAHRTEVRNHPIARMVMTAPNPDTTGVAFWSAATVCHTIFGEAYIEIQRDGNDQPTALWLRRPDLTHTKRDDDGLLYYETSDASDGKFRRIESDDMVHIQGISLDAICSVQTVRLLRHEIGNDLATLFYGGRFMKNNGAPSVVIKAGPGVVLKPEQREQILHGYLEKQTGPRQHLPMIVDQGQDVEVINQNFVNADLVNYSRLCAERICAALRCPPSLVGLMDRAPRNSSEEQTRSFMTFTLSPLLRQIEAAVEAKLAPTSAYSFRFDTRSILRANLADTAAYMQSLRMAGVTSVNELRAQFLDLPPIVGGDRYLEPANMTEVSVATNKQELEEDIEDTQDTE